jgi:hypothetical protein
MDGSDEGLVSGQDSDARAQGRVMAVADPQTGDIGDEIEGAGAHDPSLSARGPDARGEGSS